jgi:hypothetical protein
LKVKEKRIKNECEDKDRKLAIQSFLLNVPYETKELYEGAVESFYKSNMTLPEIKFIATTMEPSYQKQAQKMMDRKGRAGVY